MEIALKVLVTGAAGFIGMNCALRLLDRGDEVIGVDNLNEYYDVSLETSAPINAPAMCKISVSQNRYR